ncbi:MAG: glutathione S-transferase [Pseudomonadota bacterium]
MYTLYGADISYFSGKARAYLDWKGIDYEEVRANRDIYEKVILPRVGWPVIPVMVGPGDETLQDTSDIIDTLDARHGGPSVYPDGPLQKLAALLFEVIGDEWLVIPAMHYRWAHNRDYAYQKFGEVSAPDKSAEEQLEIGRQMAVRFEGSLPFLGITPDTAPAVESAYLRLLDQLTEHFKSHDMLLGSRPSIGDFGLYGPLYAHQYLDPASGALMKEKAPAVARWVERMRDAEATPGEFLADDAVPETAKAILREQFRDFVPVMVSTAAALTEWAKDKDSGEEIPRALGPHEFTIGGASGNRLIFPFNLWMLQRPVDHVKSLRGDAESAAAVALMQDLGGDALLDLDYPRLERRNFKLRLA